MSELDLEIRRLGEEDFGEVCALFSRVFGKNISEETLRWKYRASPKGSRGYVAVCEGQIAGFYGGLCLPFRYRGQDLTAYQFCDVMIDPRFRKRIFSKTPIVAMLGETFYRENPMDFAYGFPSVRHARLQALRLEGEGYRMVRQYRKTIGVREIRSPLSVRDGWRYFNASAPVPGAEVPDSLRFVKDGNYLAWRYRDNPAQQYFYFIFRKMFGMKGCAVCSVDGDTLKVMDLFCRYEKDIPVVLAALEQHAIRKMHDLKVILLWFHPDEPAARLAEGLGYFPEEAVPVAFRPVNLGSGVDANVFYDTYRYRMGDYDAA